MRSYIISALAVVMSATAGADTLQTIKDRGFLKCGVSVGLPGFAMIDKEGSWKGFDVDFCRATAAAIFNDPNKVEFTPTTAKNRFTVLQSKEIDVLYRNTTWTLSRDSSLGLAFSVINYYDGQGFIVRKDLGVKSAKELDGASICVQQGTTTELNLASYFRDNGMSYKVVNIENFQQAIKTFKAGRCDAFTTDRGGLAATMTTFEDTDKYRVLPEIISKEPLGPAVRADDIKFLKLVQWVYYSTVQAEEYGISKDNINSMMNASSDIKRFLGVDKNTAPDIGLPMDFAARVVKHVGNYAEIYERYLGEQTPLNLSRGENNLWTKGGLQYAPPFR